MSYEILNNQEHKWTTIQSKYEAESWITMTYLQQAQKRCWYHQYLHSNITNQIIVPKEQMSEIVTLTYIQCHHLGLTTQ